MKIVKLILLTFSLAYINQSYAQIQNNQLSVCTIEIDNYIDKNPNSLFRKLINNIYKTKHKINVTFKFIDDNDAKKIRDDVQSKIYKCDAYLGFNIDIEDYVIHPKFPIGIEFLSVAAQKDKISKWTNVSSLAEKKVGWLKAYNYIKLNYVPDSVIWSEAQGYETTDAGFNMVIEKKIDAIIDYKQELQTIINNYKETNPSALDNLVFYFDAVPGPGYFLEFVPFNENNDKNFAQIWDEEIAKLIKSGEIKKWYEAIGDKSFSTN